MPEQIFLTRSEDETIAAGRELASKLRPPALVLLIGDLGSGKTTLAKGIISGLGAAPIEDVASPTFTLIHEYGRQPKVFHVDLYRLDRVPELETLGLDDLWDQNAVVLIEWGEKFAPQLPEERVEVRLEYLSDQERRITVVW
ncbi:MAG: tRNA (adenosine(37)-N6)-threonylcarbamoyltransferase complex ATPase subunit type 1 TsaE [Acidobacteria bacterium]|nr:tRNA (adenosine(37)-N6)-threonylcarbamoyltransferase complex ATPase subunit type 1 TsaE [Acidobacteriota bacterium]